jgi:hypothetical protein
MPEATRNVRTGSLNVTARKYSPRTPFGRRAKCPALDTSFGSKTNHSQTANGGAGVKELNLGEIKFLDAGGKPL